MNFEAQEREVAGKVVEAYKASNEHYQEKIAFPEPVFAEGMEDTRRRVTNRYLDINLDFLGDGLADNAPTTDAPAPEVVVGAKGATDAPPT